MEIENLQEELERFTQEDIKLAEQYRDARVAHAMAGRDISVLIAKHIPKDASSFENKMIKLLNFEGIYEQAYNLLTSYEISKAEYKGLEAIRESYKGRIIAIQSLMKWNLTGEIAYKED